MAASGGFRSWHGPGPGPQTLNQPQMTLTRPSNVMFPARTRRDLRQGRGSFTHALRWLLVLVLLVTGLPGSTDAACSGLVTCPAGCACADVGTSGGCHVTCSSAATVDMATFSSTFSPADKVTELILKDCSISSVPANAFQQFTNLVKLDLSDNKVALLDANVFQTLTNLQVLLLAGNNLQTLPANIFAGRRQLRELSLSDNSLSDLDANLFSDLEALEVLYLNKNAFKHIPMDLLEGKSNLTTIDLSENPWTCDCTLGALLVWSRQGARQMLHPGLTSCAVSGAVWSSLNPAELPCDLSALASCFHDATSAVSTPIFPQDSIPAAILSAMTCQRACAERGRAWGVFQADVLCLCGSDAASLSSPSCTCSPVPGSPVCSRTYLPGGFPTSFGLLLGPTLLTPSNQNARLSLTGASADFSTVWRFGDGSAPVSTSSLSSGSLEHYYMAPGEYGVRLEVAGQAGRALRWPLQVLDPVRGAALEAPEYSDAQKHLDLKLRLGGGSEVDVRWRRYNSQGQEIYGKRCSAGWYQHAVHTCLRPTLLQTAEVSDYHEVTVKCGDEEAKLLTFGSFREMDAYNKLMTRELNTGAVLLVGAQKTDNVSYAWVETGHVTHFNVSMVTDSDAGDCVGVSSRGLVGLACDHVTGFVCKKGQVYCKHGGEEWNKQSCLVPLGDNIPLSQSEAESACQSISGHLATVDSQEKAEFVRQKVLGRFSSSRLWLGLSDHSVAYYYIWPTGASLGAYAPWGAGSPLPSTPGAEMCVAMVTSSTGTTTWETAECSSRTPYVCEYPTEIRVAQVRRFIAGSARLTSNTETSMRLNATTNLVTVKTDLIILPGSWFPHPGGVQSWRFSIQNVPTTPTELRLQVYRPVCESGYTLVPPGCAALPSPFATCVEGPVSCSEDQPCPAGRQFCPLANRCLALSEPCTCSALDSASSTGCENLHYTSQAQLTSPLLNTDSYRYDGTVPKYTLIGQTGVTLTPDAAGLFNVDAGDIQIEANDVIGVQFVSGDYGILCETATADMDTADLRQSILSVSLPKNPVMEKVNVNGGIWLDSIVCGIQAVFTNATVVSPPRNIIDESVHTVGDYTYKATLHSPLSPELITLQKTVTMQYSVKGLNMAVPNPKWPRRTVGASKLAVVEALRVQDLLWFITQGTDPVANWTISDASPGFSDSCPVSLTNHVSQCRKNYQFLTYTLTAGSPGTLTTITTEAWNKVSHASLTIDVLAQERIKGLKIILPVSREFVSGVPASLSATIEAGSEVEYEWDFGDGTESTTSETTRSHLYQNPSIYTISVKASNYLDSVTVDVEYKLCKAANVNNLNITAPDNVDMMSSFSVKVFMNLTPGSCITTLIDYGDSNTVTVTEPEFQAQPQIVVSESYKYATGNTYDIKVYVIDNLHWDGVTDIRTLIGQPYVKTKTHTIQAWTVLSGLTISSTPTCHAVNSAVHFTASFPTGHSRTGYTFNWDFGDTQSTSTYELDSPTHTYTSPGAYDVELNIQNSDTKGTVKYEKCIEIPVSDVALSPKNSPLSLTRGQKVSTGFHVSARGSDLQYLWTFGGETSVLPPSGFSAEYATNGTFDVKLKVHNHISSEEKTVQVRVKEIIRGLKINHDGITPYYFKVNQGYGFQAQIDTGSDVTITWTVQTPGVSQGNSDPYQTTISWPRSGSYGVSVTARNGVSQQSKTITAIVQTVIDSVTLMGVGDVEVNDAITLTADVGAEVDTSTVRYEWTLCILEDGTCSEMPSTSGTLVTSPTQAGSYNYTVRAYNDVSSVTQSTVTKVWGKLKVLSILHPKVINNWAIKEDELEFTAELAEGIATTYNWSLEGSGYKHDATGKTFRIKLSEEIRYVLTLTATNPIDSATATLTFSVQEAIEKLRILSILGDIAYTGETLKFNATLAKGSIVRYTWTITPPNSPPVEIARFTDAISYEFPTVGEYLLQLTGSNKVTDVVESLKVTIMDPLPGYGIDVRYPSAPYVHQNIPIDCGVLGIKEPVTGYKWSIYDTYPPATGYEGTINHNFAVKGSYIIEVRATVTSRLQPIVIRLTIYVQGKLPPVTLTQDKTITEAGGSVTFTATVQEAVDDLEYLWKVGTETTEVNQNNVFTYTFQNAGVIRIQVMPRNKVSFSEDNVVVIVQDLIEDIVLENCCHYNSTQESSLTANVTRGTNATFFWTIVQESRYLMASAGSEIQYNFPGVGEYNVTISAVNLVSRKVESFLVHTLDAVSGLQFVNAPSEVYAGQFVMFQAKVASGTDVRYRWVLIHLTLSGDGVEEQDSLSDRFPMDFTKGGSFLLRVTAYNNVSSEIRTKFITSSVIRCDPMTLRVIGGTRRVGYRSRSVELEVEVELNCTRYPIVYTWEIYSDCETMDHKVSIGDVTVNTPQLVLPPRALGYGAYCVKFTAMYFRTPVVIDVTIDLLIIESRIKAIIDGGTLRSVPSDRTLTISAGKSYDPDLVPGEPAGLRYDWTCQSTFQCFLPQNTSVLTIPASLLQPERTYDIQLTVSKPGRRSATAKQKIVILSPEGLVVDLSCISCRDSNQFNLSTGMPVKLLGSCSNCGDKPLTYLWSVTRDDGQDFQLTPQTSTTGSDKQNLVILQESLVKNHGYTFRVSIQEAGRVDNTGFAELTMHPNQPPTGGTCHVANKILPIIAMEQKLEIACENWIDPDDTSNSSLIYMVYVKSLQKKKAWYPLYSGPKARGAFYVAPLEVSEEIVLVNVDVIDKLGGKTIGLSTPISTKVQVPENTTLLGYLSDMTSTTLPILVLHQTPKELLQFSIALTNQLNFPYNDSSQADQALRIATRVTIIKALKDMNFSKTLDDLQQLSFLIKQLTDIPQELPQNREVSKDLLELVTDMANWLDSHATTATNSEDVIPTNILNIINNCLTGLQGLSAANSNWSRGFIEEYVGLIESILHSYSLTTIPGEAPFGFTFGDDMYATGQQVMPSDIEKSFQHDGFSVSLPGNLLGRYTNGEAVFQSFLLMSPNPLQWGDSVSTKKVTSKVIAVSFKYNNGSDISISNLDDNNLVGLTVPAMTSGGEQEKTTRNTSSIFEPNESFKVTFNTSQFASGGLNIEVTGHVIAGDNESEADVAGQLALRAYLGYDFEPYWYNYSQKLDITYNATGHQDYTFFSTIGSNNVKRIYVTVTNDNPTRAVNVSVLTYEVQCQFYHTSVSAWSSSGCQPTAASNRSHTACQCNHLTIFGASSLISPGDIDFSDLARLDLANNPVVVILVAVIAGVFIVVVFWARQYDLQDLHNISIVPLCGRDGLYKYEVVVITGRKRGAGTSAHVGIKLYGDEAKSGARHLSRMGAFQRNSEDSFLVASEVSLGLLQKVHIWHDNTGKHPSWYVSRVIVRDLQTNHKAFFLLNSWLSLTKEKCSLDKYVFVAGPEELSSFGTVFHSETNRGFAERHVWLSVWDRPPRSRFTRVQRVVCCTTLLYSFMCANVMWYGLIKTPQREAQVLGQVSISWQDFVVGILASIVVFPINFAIIQIFRFTKVKVNAYDYGTKPGTAQTIEVEAMCDMSQAGDSFIAYDRKNSVLPLQRESSSDSILVPIESKKWWSYDTILKWPEKMPNDPRPESGMAGPLKKRAALRSIHTPKDTDYDEFVIDDDTLKAPGARYPYDNNRRRMPITTTSGTLSISQSIAEIEEDIVAEETKPECSKKYESVAMTTLQVPSSSSGYGSGDQATSSSTERSDSWSSNTVTVTNTKPDSELSPNPNLLAPPKLAGAPKLDSDSGAPKLDSDSGAPKLDSDSGEVNQALMEIDTNIKESQLIEPRLLNRKKSSMNQGNTPNVDILRLDDFEMDPSKDITDEDLADLAALDSKGKLRKTKSKTRVSKRWAQIVIPPEYETYKNDHFKIFDPEDEYDAVSLNRSNTLKSRGSSMSSTTTSSSRFHQLMPMTTTRVRWLLPHWWIYVAYTLCFLLSGISIIVTILYGHSFGRELALKWLLAFFISFLDSVFILEPLKVLALAVFVALLTRGLHEEDEGVETRPIIESNEQLKDVRMRPIGGFALLQAREEGHKVQRMHRLMRHSAIYVLFLWTAFFITYRAHNTAIFPINADIEGSLLKPTTGTGIAFHDVKRPEDVWSWLREVSAPSLYPNQNETTNTQRLLVGEVRLRQLRSAPVTCHVRAALLGMSASAILDHGCYGNPGWQEETAQYNAGWTPTSGNATWRYFSAVQALGEHYDGLVGSYGGGGYVQNLGPTVEDAQLTISNLAKANWTDRATRAVFMEANLYTVPAQLYSTVRILAEFPVSGGVWMSQDVQTFQLQNHVPGRVTGIMIFMAFLSVIWLYLLFVVLTGLRRHTFHYFLDFWHVIQFTVMCLVFGVIVVFIHQAVVDTAAFHRHSVSPHTFNSFYESAATFRAWKTLCGMLVFLLTAWMVRLLRFVKPLSTYGQTIAVAAPRLLGCSLVLVLFLFSMSHLGHLWFGSLLGSFRSLGSSFLTIFGLVRARSMHALLPMSYLSPDMAGFLVFSFISTVVVAAMGIFMAVLNSTYKMVRLQTHYRSSMEMPDYEMVDFMMKRFKKYMGITKPKPAFRRVKFQGMPSLSSRSSMSSRTGMSQSLVSSGSYDPFGLDALAEETYLEDLLERCVPTWNRMLEKLERVLWLDREITRLETSLIEALGNFLKKKCRLPMLPRLLQAKRSAGRILGSKGSRCHRSNSESLMTNVRARQIREALNAELQEMEEKIIADVEVPTLQHKGKSCSFTEAGEGKDHDSLVEYEMEILGEANPARVIRVAEGKPPMAPGSHSSVARPLMSKPPPAQPKRFLNSAGPRRTFHEAGTSSNRKESPSATRRRGSATSGMRHRPGSPVVTPGSVEVKDAPKEAQKAYTTKLPRRDIKMAPPFGSTKANFTRRPTSEQSERVKRNPDLPLPKQDSPES